MVLGVAFSGGGITALLCAACISNTLEDLFPGEFFTPTSPTVSTISGGSVGYMLWVNSPQFHNLTYPSSNLSALTYDELNTESKGPDGNVWFGSAINYIPHIPSTTAATAFRAAAAATFVVSASTSSALGLRASSSSSSSSSPGSGWWEDALDTLGWLGYGVSSSKIDGGGRPFHSGFTLLRKSACPMKLDKKTGEFASAATSLLPAEVDMNSHEVTAPRNVSVAGDFTTMDGATVSSNFASTGVVQSSIMYYTLQWILSEAQVQGAPPSLDGAATAKDDGSKHSSSSSSTSDASSGETFYMMDGGLVDTTGIAGLLRRKADSVVAFYSINSGSLLTLDSPFSRLFGVVTDKFDAQNDLSGAALLQVFSSDLFVDVKANLTNTSVEGSNQLARLSNVQVLDNEYLGIEAYVLKTLVIIAHEYSEPFVAELAAADPEIPKHIDRSRWPNNIPVSMSTFEANMLCVYSGWRVRQHEQTLREVLDEVQDEEQS